MGVEWGKVPDSKSALDEGVYLAKLVRFDESEPGEYDGRAFERVYWVFHMADFATKTPIYNADSSLYEYRQRTSTKIGRKAKAKEFFEALLGRELQPGDEGAALAELAIGKSAKAVVAANDNNWIEIVRMNALPAGTGKPAPGTPPVAASTGAPDDEVPF